MERLVEALLEVLCYSPDVLQRRCDEVNGGNVGERRSIGMQLSEIQIRTQPVESPEGVK